MCLQASRLEPSAELKIKKSLVLLRAICFLPLRVTPLASTMVPHRIAIIVTVALLAAVPGLSARSQVATLVNPVWGTGGGLGFGGWGNQQRNPGAMAINPMMRLGPDTTRHDVILGEVWSKLNRHGGYFYSDNAIRAFSHTHVQASVSLRLLHPTRSSQILSMHANDYYRVRERLTTVILA